jgi:hypothetical protein
LGRYRNEWNANGAPTVSPATRKTGGIEMYIGLGGLLILILILWLLGVI